MKIAMVTPYWLPVRGGVTTYVAGLSKELRAQGHEVLVIAREGSPPGAVIVPLKGSAFVRRAARELESFAPDAVHAHGHWYALAAALRYRRGRRQQCPVVFTLHTSFPKRAWWRRKSLSILLSRADFLTGVSADLLGATVRALRPRTRTRVTRAGMAADAANQPDLEILRKQFRLEGRKPLIAYLGRFAWEAKVQGVQELIRAIRLVRETIPTATLVVGGDGPLRGRIEEVATREAPDGVVFVGEVANPVPQFYALADVYAHISHQEGLPLTVLEAMACRTPVVATAVGGIPEVIRDGQNGLLVSGAPKEIAAAIVHLLESPELAEQLRERAAHDVAHEFTWPRAAARFLPLYGGKVRHRVVVTVDLERDYGAGVASFRGLEEAVPRLLTLFARHGIRAYMFATSDLCERFSDRLREVVRQAHGLGCHGESHNVEYLSRRPYAWQLESIRRATDILESATGIRPRAFRAPNFSANRDTIRALEALNYALDSSVLPGRVVRAKRVVTLLDFRVAPRDPYRPSRENPAIPGDAKLLEFPVTENPLSPGGPIGLGYVNVYGVDKALEAVGRSAADPCVFLIHPWELLDPPSGNIPKWMRTGCTSDASGLDSFLGRLRGDHDVTTIEAELQDLL